VHVISAGALLSVLEIVCTEKVTFADLCVGGSGAKQGKEGAALIDRIYIAYE